MITIGNLLAILNLQNNLTPGMNAATASLNSFNSVSQVSAYQLTVLGRGLREAGTLATGAFTVPIVAAATETIKFGAEFETQMTRVSTLAGATMQEVNGLRQSVMDLGPAVGIGPAKLAEGLFVLESYGLKGAEALDTLRIAGEMAALGMGSTAENARALTGALFAYKDQNITAAEAADILTKTVQVGNMRIEELTPALARVNPIAASMGVKFQDVAAAIATFTHAGVDSAMAATGIRAILNSILTDSAKTEKGFIALAKATGDNTITMANFRAEMAEKGLTQAMVDLAANVDKAGEAGVTAFGQIIPNIRGLTEAMGVYLKNGGMVVDLQDKIMNSQGTLAKSTEELHKTWQFQWDQMKAEVEKMFITLGDAGLMKMFKDVLALVKDDLLPILKKLIEFFNDLPTPVKEFIVVLAGLLAVLGPGLVVLGQLAMAAGNIARGWALLSGGGAAAGGMSALIGFLMNPYVLGAAVVLGGVALAVYKIQQNMANLGNNNSGGGTVTFVNGLKDANGKLAVTAEQAKSAADNVTELTNGFSISIPSIAAHAKAVNTVNNEHKTLLERVAALNAEEKGKIDTDKALGMTISQIAKKTGIAADVIGVYERQTSKAHKESSDWQKVLDEIDSTGENFRDTIDGIDGSVADYAETLLIAGAQTESVRKLYGLTETQIKALKKAADEYTNTLKLMAAVEAGRGKSDPQAWTEIARMGQTLNPDIFENILKKVHGIEQGVYGTGEGLQKMGLKVNVMDDLRTMERQSNSARESLSLTASELQKMAQLAGSGPVGTGLKNMSIMFSELRIASDMTSKMIGDDNKAIGGSFGPLSVILSNHADKGQKAAAAVAAVAAVYSGAIAVWDATSSHATAAGNALDGMMTGAQAGAAFGPWGMAIGAAAGFMVGIIKGKPEWAKAANEIANDFGVKISDKLAKSIADSAKDFGGSSQASAVGHLADIISEAGGLTKSNLSQMTSRLHDVFSFIEMHQMTIAQGAKVINDNWATFVDASTDGDGRISDSLKEIIRLNDVVGTQSKAIADWQKSQGASLLDNFNDIAGSLKDVISGYDDIKKAIDDALPNSKELAKALKDQREAAEHAKYTLADLGIQAIATFSAAVASGTPFNEALAKIHPSLDLIRKGYEDLGLDVDNAALKQLLFADVINTKNPELVAGVHALGAEMITLDNLGLMNIDTFGAIERTAGDMYARLLNAAIDATGGYDVVTGKVHDLDAAQRQALSQMQDYLHKAKDEAEKLGEPLDDNTQRMIDQSKALGIWKDTGKSSMDTLIDKVGELVDAILGKLKPAIDQVAKPVPAPWSDWPTAPSENPDTPPGFSTGTFGVTGAFFKNFGSGSNVILHGNEAVVRPDQAAQFAAQHGGGGGEQTIIVKTYLDGYQIAEALTKVSV